jgi:hypothetical protein
MFREAPIKSQRSIAHFPPRLPLESKITAKCQSAGKGTFRMKVIARVGIALAT